MGFKIASYSACYLTNDDYILYLLEKRTRENQVIKAVKKWFSILIQIVESTM